MMHQSKVRPLAVNALVVALYVILAVGPGMFNLASGVIQFRISEGLNHLVTFSRKYLLGVVLGVIVFNAIFSPLGWLDVVFGGGQSLLGLSLTILVAPHLPRMWQKMTMNTVFMTVTMFLIALEIVWTGHLNMAAAFWPTYGSLMLSELIIMAITAPIMLLADKAVHFKRLMD